MIKNSVLGILIMALALSCSPPVQKQQVEEEPVPEQDWRTEVTQTLKLFGHRNWIVIADGAYPQQSNPAIKTITIDEDQLGAVEFMVRAIDEATHVEANIFLDKEMAFVPEKDANGIEAYRTQLNDILTGRPVKTMLHEDIIRELDASAKLFNVLIIKTDLAIPYTSVFFQLECGYWDEAAEQDLRNNLIEK